MQDQNIIYLKGTALTRACLFQSKSKTPGCYFILETTDQVVHEDSSIEFVKSRHHVAQYGSRALNTRSFLSLGDTVKIQGFLRSSTVTDSNGKTHQTAFVQANSISRVLIRDEPSEHTRQPETMNAVM